MHLNSSDITRLTQRGVAPNHPNFANEVRHVQEMRQQQELRQAENQVRRLTGDSGFTLKNAWSDPRKWVKDTEQRFAPITLVLCIKIELWTKENSRDRVAFFFRSGKPSLFDFVSPGQWRRVL